MGYCEPKAKQLIRRILRDYTPDFVTTKKIESDQHGDMLGFDISHLRSELR